MNDTPDILHLGAPSLSMRLFGNTDKRNLRRIYRMAEMKEGERPSFIRKIGTSPCAFESQIRAFAAGAGGPAA